MAKTPIDRTSYASRLAKAHQDLEMIKATLADVMLAADRAPTNTGLQSQLADLKKQRDRAREVIADLETMQDAATREAGITQAVNNDKEIDELCAVCVAASDEMEVLLPTIVAHIEDVNSPLVRYVNLGAKRQQALHALQRLSGKKFGNRLVRVDGHGPLSDALIGAMCRSGIGHVGSSLGPHVIVSLPTRVPTLADAQRSGEGDRARVLELLAECKTPLQPATTTEEI